jgi:hypothetical protein
VLDAALDPLTTSFAGLGAFIISNFSDLFHSLETDLLAHGIRQRLQDPAVFDEHGLDAGKAFVYCGSAA